MDDDGHINIDDNTCAATSIPNVMPTLYIEMRLLNDNSNSKKHVYIDNHNANTNLIQLIKS